MPRKAKEKIDENEIISVEKNIIKKNSTKTRKSTLAKIIENSVNEIDSEKKVSPKKSSVKSSKSDSSSKKATKSEKAVTAKKNTTSSKKNIQSTKSLTQMAESEKSKTQKSNTTKNNSKKVTASKSKSNVTKQSLKKSSTSKVAKSEEFPPVQIIEYYDLPYKYGNTIVRLLAQTPKTLFVYWEVSDLDIAEFKKLYGDDFFQKTKPLLIVHNLTLNKTTEIEINDFANCWYLNTEDADCKYDIELVRKFINKSNQNNFDNNGSDYLYIAQSNELQSPNNHILFEKIKEFVIFRDVSNGNVIKKNIKSFKFLKDIYKFYREMYNEEILNNPSSQFNI